MEAEGQSSCIALKQTAEASASYRHQLLRDVWSNPTLPPVTGIPAHIRGTSGGEVNVLNSLTTNGPRDASSFRQFEDSQRSSLTGQDDLKVVSKRQPTEQELKDLLFCWKVAKFVEI